MVQYLGPRVNILSTQGKLSSIEMSAPRGEQEGVELLGDSEDHGSVVEPKKQRRGTLRQKGDRMVSHQSGEGFPFFKTAIVAPQEPASRGASLNDSTRGFFSRKEWTMFRWTPFPFPWMIRTSFKPFFWHSNRYSSNREGISLGENV